MTYSIDFIMPDAPDSNSASNQLWWTKRSEKKRIHRQIWGYARAARPFPSQPLEHALITVTRLSRAPLDGDNLYHGLKYVLDALGVKHGCGIIKDDAFDVVGMPRAKWQRYMGNTTQTRIEVVECSIGELDLTAWNFSEFFID